MPAPARGEAACRAWPRSSSSAEHASLASWLLNVVVFRDEPF